MYTVLLAVGAQLLTALYSWSAVVLPLSKLGLLTVSAEPDVVAQQFSPCDPIATFAVLETRFWLALGHVKPKTQV